MISTIICSRTPARFAAVRENLSRRFGGEPSEFIVIEDARSLAEGYNRGLRQSRGDVVIMCHDDIEILAEDFTKRLLSRLDEFDLLGVAGSTRLTGPKWISAGPPYIFGQVAHFVPDENLYDVIVWGTPGRCIADIQVMDGVFLAGRRKVFESVPFDEITFQGFHLYDVDFTARAAMAGFRLAVCTDLMLIHASVGQFDQSWKGDSEKFMAKHAAAIGTPPKNAWKAWTVMLIKAATKEDVRVLLEPRNWE